MKTVLNVVAFIINLAITGLVGNAIPGTMSNEVLSDKYQTLITPVGWAFSIWGIIFGSQLIFTITQILPGFRGYELVEDGVGYSFVGACLAQAAWGLVFGFEYIGLSAVFMLMILFSLVRIIVSQSKLDYDDDHPNRDFWLFVFPFRIHCGWITAASLININLLLVRYQVGATVQCFAALASLAALLMTGLIRLFGFTSTAKTDYVIPCVLAWAALGIHVELGAPNDLIRTTFDQSTINLVRTVDGGVFCVLMICIAAKVILPASFFARQPASIRGEQVPLQAEHE